MVPKHAHPKQDKAQVKKKNQAVTSEYRYMHLQLTKGLIVTVNSFSLRYVCGGHSAAFSLEDTFIRLLKEEAFWIYTLSTSPSKSVMRTLICGTFTGMDSSKRQNRDVFVSLFVGYISY